MKRTLRYYYYRVYKYYSNERTNPFFSSFCLMSMLLYCNVLAVVNFIAVFLDSRVAGLPSFKGGRLAFFWPLLFLIPGFFIFKYLIKQSGLHRLIMQEFNDETIKHKNLSILFVFLYIICSISCFVFALWLRQEVRGY